ncbi:hypothetical protein BGZ95_009030, partial [Linnemannia exigua]
DPFQVLSVDPTITRNILARLSKLIILLLRSNPEANVSDLLRLAFLQDPKEPKNPPIAPETAAIPYHSLLTNVGIQPCSPLIERVFHSVDTGFGGYLERCKVAGRFELEGIFERLTIGTSKVMSFVANQELCKDLTWALCANAERIRSLIIPISDVTRYLSMVGRFELLADVTFVLDKDIRKLGTLDQRPTPTEQEVLTRLRAERIQHLEGMVLFVQEHRRLHPNVLATGRCIKGRRSIMDCPGEYQLRLLQPLPPLFNPCSLDHNNWTQFLFKSYDTNLSYVKSLDLPPAPGPVFMRRYSEYLRRCRSLEHFKTIAIKEGLFHWAVDERRRYNADIKAGWLPQHALVPLRSFIVKNGKPYAGQQINDIAFAFGNTLKSIKISGRWRQLHSNQDEPGPIIDGDEPIWFLPRLSKLMVEMETEDSYLHLHPEFLSRCPRLDTVSLYDRLQGYKLNSVHHWKPAALPDLKYLRLQGTPAASFHPDTLKNTPELVELHLGTVPWLPGIYYIPPPEQFTGIEHGEPSDMNPIESSTPSPSPSPTPPIWTWDWELPKLTNLTLRVEFAYRFQFRMLDRTPNLDTFVCNIRSWSGLHIRILPLEDLFSPGFTAAATHHPSSPIQSDGSSAINNMGKETELEAGVHELSMEEKCGGIFNFQH